MARSQTAKTPSEPRRAAPTDDGDDLMEVFEDASDKQVDEDDETMDADGIDEDLQGAAAELDLEDASEYEEDEEADEGEGEGGVQLSPSVIPMIGSRVAGSAPSLSLDDASTNNATLDPSRPTPYVHDAGHLLITDPNPLHVDSGDHKLSETLLASTARDAAQSLLNHLLTTCPITTSKSATSGSEVVMNLPAPSLALPREKPVPTPEPPTTWEKFAAKKGIGKNKRRNMDGENRAGKMVYDEASGEWVPRYGYKGKNKANEKEWLVEVDTKAERKKAEEGKAGQDPRTASRAERLERMKRNERKMRANDRKSLKGR